MKTAKLIFLTIILLFSILQNCSAQTTKGMWTAGGQFDYDQITVNNRRNSTILIAPELGYAFLNRWMVWGKISISLEERYSRVGHELNLRYAFMKRPGLEGYLGLEYGLQEQRFLINGATNKREQISIGPFAGYLHFFNPNMALNVSMHYPVYTKNKRDDDSYSGNIEIKIGINFYFDSKLEKDSIPKKRSLKKGQWVIGGAINFGGGNENRFRSLEAESFNKITPFAGLLLNKHWMVGSRFSYFNMERLVQLHFGLQPFGRYYFKSNKKRLFYGEVNTAFHFRHVDKDSYSIEDNSVITERSAGMGVGMSRWIFPNILLDFYFGGKRGKRLFSPTGISRSNRLISFQQFVFRIGLEAYL